MEVLIRNLSPSPRRPPISRSRIQRLIDTLLKLERERAETAPVAGIRLPAGQAELSVVFCDDRFIQELNRQYRGLDRATDVLSFPQEPVPGAPDLLGDVVISLETARRQARAEGHSPVREVEWLLCHGVLHLLGHEDESEEGLQQMRRRQLEALRDAGS